MIATPDIQLTPELVSLLKEGCLLELASKEQGNSLSMSPEFTGPYVFIEPNNSDAIFITCNENLVSGKHTFWLTRFIHSRHCPNCFPIIKPIQKEKKRHYNYLDRLLGLTE